MTAQADIDEVLGIGTIDEPLGIGTVDEFLGQTVVAPAGETYENLTTFTESDDTAGVLSQTTTRSQATALKRVDTGYVYKDYTATHFDTAFTHDVDVYITSGDSTGHFGVWFVTNSPGTYQDMSTGVEIMVFTTSTPGEHEIAIYDLSSKGTYDLYQSLSTSTTYYLRIIRSAGTFTCKIYSTDADRDGDTGSNLLDTISILSGQTATTFQYLGVAAARDAAGTAVITAYGENYELVSE